MPTQRELIATLLVLINISGQPVLIVARKDGWRYKVVSQLTLDVNSVAVVVINILALAIQLGEVVGKLNPMVIFFYWLHEMTSFSRWQISEVTYQSTVL